MYIIKKLCKLIVIINAMLFTIGCHSLFDSLEIDNDSLLEPSSEIVSSNQQVSLNSRTYLMTEIRRWTLAEWCSQTGHNNSSNQSCAAYGNYAFVFAPGSPHPAALIVDILRPSNVYYAPLPPSVHANSAQFIDIFFEDGDEFPLLIMSNCEADEKTNSINVLRVTKNNLEFDFSLVKKIYFLTPGMVNYGSSVVFDTDRRKLVSVYNPNGTWRVFENNPILIKEFCEPQWLDANDELFEDDDGEIISVYPFFVFQGISYDDGKLYIGCSFPSENNNWKAYEGLDGSKECVLVIERETKEVLYSISATRGREIEGVCVYEKELYVSQRTDASDDDEIATFLFKYNLNSQWR